MKRILIVALSVLVSGQSLYAQSAQGADGLSNMQGLSYGFGSYRTFDSRFKGVMGSPLMMESYLKGEILMTDDTRVTTERINYDAFNDDLLVARANGEIIVKKEMVKGFSINNNGSLLNFVRVTEEGKEVFGQQLVSGNIELLKKNKKRIEQGSEVSTYSSSKSYSEFVNDNSFVWRAGTGEVKEAKKKTILSEFSGQRKEIETFLKEEHIAFNKEEDLIRLFQFLNRTIPAKGA